MLEKIYSFGGLDLRSSDINREKNRASDLQNVVLTSTRELTKRDGYAEDIAALPFPVLDTLEYRKTRELLLMSPTGLRKKDGATTKSVNFGATSPPTIAWEGIDYTEYANTLYFTDIGGVNELFKYDGYMQYRAGMPQPIIVSTAGGSGYYYRVAFYHIDLQGNITWSDYAQINDEGANLAFTFETLSHPDYDGGFHTKYGNSDGVNTVDSVTLTIPVLGGHNYVAGDWIRALNDQNEFIPLEIDSVSAGPDEITFTSDSVGTHTFNYGAAEPLERRTFLMISRSTDATFGYKVDSYVNVNSINITQATAATGASLASDIPLNDVYDTGIVRQLPPRCKYITVYGGTTLVLGNYANTKDLQPDLQNTTPQQGSSIFWSSVFSEFGTSVENFLPFYREIVGKSDEGDVTGLFGASDSLIILKENQVYYLNGVLQEQAYRPRSALSERVGCISHRSIVEAEGGCLFMSAKGIYLAKYGQKPIEITDNIEPLFTSDTTGLDLSRVRGEIDYLKEQIYWFIPAALPADDLVVMFDYYYKEWFKHKGIHADSGLTLINDVELYHCDGTDLFKRGGLNDNTLAIDAFYATTWHHAGAPSIRKKFTNFIVASISSLVWACNIKTQEDWTETDRTDVTLDMTGNNKVDDKRINITQCKSLRFILGNANKNESLFLSGYEFVVEGTQEDPKGES